MIITNQADLAYKALASEQVKDDGLPNWMNKLQTAQWWRILMTPIDGGAVYEKIPPGVRSRTSAH
jgi:hypothetical protein